VVYRHAFLMQRVGVSLAEAVKLCTFDASILCNRFEFPQEMTVRFAFAVRRHLGSGAFLAVVAVPRINWVWLF
jgi:hypothetical protein